MRGPMGKPKNRVENPGKLLKRLMDYIFRDYKFHCIIVFILIFVGVIANVQGTMFTRDLIDKYITPFLLSSDTPNFTPLAHAIGKVACWSRNRGNVCLQPNYDQCDTGNDDEHEK